MRKSLFVFVVLAILASTVPASAQRIGYIPQTPDGWYYRFVGDNVQMLTADNLGMVRGLTDQLRRSNIRSLTDDLRWNGSAWGLQTTRGFYPMYDRDRKPMSKKKAAIVYGTIGAVGGELVGRYVGAGTTRNQITSTIVGAGVGALVGALTHRGNNKDVVVAPPHDGGGQQSVRIARDGTPVAVGARPRNRNVQSSLGIGNQPDGMTRRAVNRTGMEIVVFHKGDDPRTSEPVEVIARNQPWTVPLSSDGYDVYVLIPTGTLGVQDVRKADVVPNHDLNGWDIVVPAVQ